MTLGDLKSAVNHAIDILNLPESTEIFVVDINNDHRFENYPVQYLGLGTEANKVFPVIFINTDQPKEDFISCLGSENYYGAH